MPVFLQLDDLNQVFSQLSEPPIIINDLLYSTEEDKNYIHDLITTRYSTDMITLLPSCRCGITKGEFSVGVKCKYCNTSVKSTIQGDVEPNVWYRKPVGVNKLISPIIWTMLKNRFKKSGFNIIQWLTDTTYRPGVKQPAVINKIVEAGVARGYNNFVDNFDSIMDVLFSIRDFKKDGVDHLRNLLISNRRIIFSDYLPIPNKSILIIEKTNVGVYVDPNIVKAVDAILMMISIDKDFHDQNPRVKENRTAKAISKFSEFFEQFNKTNLSPKQGLFRRHTYGSRTNFSFRAVISSITDTHVYNQFDVPWGVGLTAFRLHLINKLQKLGMDNNSAVGLLYGHVEKYHPLLDKLLNELLTEAEPHGGILCCLQRNPSLLQGSALRLKIRKFKTNTDDHTIGLSILCVKSLNADFDGDAVNVSIALDHFMSAKWYPLEPMFNIMQLTKPGEISNNISIPKPCISTISNWLSS